MPCTRSMRSGSSRKKAEEEEPDCFPAPSPPKTRKRTVRDKKVNKTEGVRNIAKINSPLPSTSKRPTRPRVRSKVPEPCETPVEPKKKSRPVRSTTAKKQPIRATEEKENDGLSEDESDDDLFRPIPRSVASKSKPSTRTTAKKTAQTTSKRKIKTASKAALQPEQMSDPDVSTADEGKPHKAKQIRTLTYQELHKCHIIPVKTAFSSTLCEAVPRFFKKITDPEEEKRQEEEFQALLNAPEVEMPPPPPPGKTKRTRVKRARSPESTPSQTAIPPSFNFEGSSIPASPAKKKMNRDDISTPEKEASVSSQEIPIASSSKDTVKEQTDSKFATEKDDTPPKPTDKKKLKTKKTKKEAETKDEKVKGKEAREPIEQPVNPETEKIDMNSTHVLPCKSVSAPEKEASSQEIPIASSSKDTVKEQTVSDSEFATEKDDTLPKPTDKKKLKIKKTKKEAEPKDEEVKRKEAREPIEKTPNSEVIPVEVLIDEPANPETKKIDMNSTHVLPCKTVSTPEKEASPQEIPIASSSKDTVKEQTVSDSEFATEKDDTLPKPTDKKKLKIKKTKKEAEPKDEEVKRKEAREPIEETPNSEVELAETLMGRPVNPETENCDMNSTYVLPCKAVSVSTLEKEASASSQKVPIPIASTSKDKVEEQVVSDSELPTEKVDTPPKPTDKKKLKTKKTKKEAEPKDEEVKGKEAREPIEETPNSEDVLVETLIKKPVNPETEKTDMNSTYVLPCKADKKMKPSSLLNVTVCVKKCQNNQIDEDIQQMPTPILPPASASHQSANSCSLQELQITNPASRTFIKEEPLGLDVVVEEDERVSSASTSSAWKNGDKIKLATKPAPKEKGSKKDQSTSSCSSNSSLKSASSQPNLLGSSKKLAASSGLGSGKTPSYGSTGKLNEVYKSKPLEAAEKRKQEILQQRIDSQKKKMEEWRKKTEKNKLEEEKRIKEKQKLVNPISASILKKPAPILNAPCSGFIKPKMPFGMGPPGSKPESGVPSFIKPLPLPKQPYHFKPPPPPPEDGEMDDSFKTASNSFLDATIDGPLCSYDITTYEDLDEDLKHRENKTVPNWASDKESLKTALFSMVYLSDCEQSLQLSFPKPDRSFKLFPMRIH